MMFSIVFAVALAIPPAVKVISIATLVYGVIQAAKKSPWLGPLIDGWWAVALNVVLVLVGVLISIPAAQLYTMQTLETILITVLTSAGIHGTVQNTVLKN